MNGYLNHVYATLNKNFFSELQSASFPKENQRSICDKIIFSKWKKNTTVVMKRKRTYLYIHLTLPIVVLKRKCIFISAPRAVWPLLPRVFGRGMEEGQPRQLLVRATFSAFYRPSQHEISSFPLKKMLNCITTFM